MNATVNFAQVVKKVSCLVQTQGPIQAACLSVCSKYEKNVWKYRLNMVNLYRVMSMLKPKINVNLPQLLCIVVSAAQNGDLVGFALTVTTSYKGWFSLATES